MPHRVHDNGWPCDQCRVPEVLLTPRAAVRPARKAREGRIPGVCNRRATPRPGMQRRPNVTGLRGRNTSDTSDRFEHGAQTRQRGTHLESPMPTPSIPIAERRPAAAAAAVGERLGNWRWYICGLLFAATTINYIDRQVIGILKPTLQSEFGWSEIDYADIVFAFQLAYAIGLLIAGRLMDRFGARLGFSLIIVIWSLAAMAHAEASAFGPGVAALLGAIGLTYSGSVAGFIAARFALGLGEAGNFPASIKVVAEWFPKRERAFATGIFNSGTNIGALVTPLVVPMITLAWGWRAAFIATGAIGFLWLVAWWALYRRPEDHPSVSKAELAYIQSDPP